MKTKIKLSIIFCLLMLIVNCCAASYIKYDVAVDEVTGVITVISSPNDSTIIQYRK